MHDNDAVSDIDALVTRARELARRGGRTILGVAGSPGSGKSTISAALVAELGADAVLVPMDGFHLANAELARLGRVDRKGAPDTFDAAGYVNLLRRLRRQPASGEAIVYAPYFDRGIEESIGSAIPVAAKVPLVITEGNYLLLDEGPWREVRPLLDEAWFVTIVSEVRVERLIKRHIEHGRSPEAAREWVLRSDEANAQLVDTTRGAADLVVARPCLPIASTSGCMPAGRSRRGR